MSTSFVIYKPDGVGSILLVPHYSNIRKMRTNYHFYAFLNLQVFNVILLSRIVVIPVLKLPVKHLLNKEDTFLGIFVW